MIYYDLIDSPVGQLLLTGDGQNLTGLFLENHKGGPSVSPDWQRDPSKFEEARKQLQRYFCGELTEFDVSVALKGTPLQQAVWKELRQIPFGKTVSYGDIAKKLNAPSACRAVGTAVGRNPVSIIVPCHRVLGSSGAITGYAGGVERKRVLLDLEKR